MLGFLGSLGVGRGEVRSAGERSSPLRCWVGCAWVLGAKIPLSKQPGCVAAAQRRVKYQLQLYLVSFVFVDTKIKRC